MKRLLVVVAVLLVGAAGWFFVSPLFIDRAVDEGFDFVQPDGSLDMTVIDAMPAAARSAQRDDIMKAAAAAPDTAVSDGMPERVPRIVASGEFVDADAIHKGSGTATIYRLPDNREVLRLSDFRTTNGPALVVYLAKHPSPQSAADVTGPGFLSLGKLKGNVGNQNYPLPAGSDASEYGSVVIWCELFDVLFSPAALAAPADVEATN